MKFLSKLNIHGKILLNITIAIIILGTVSIIEYNSLIITDKIKKANQYLYNIQTILYRIQYDNSQVAVLAYEAKDLNNLTLLISTIERFKNVSTDLKTNISNLKTYILNQSVPNKIKPVVNIIKDSVYAYEKIINNVFIEFNQLSKYKKRLLIPHSIEQNYLKFLQEEEELNTPSLLNNPAQIKEIVEKIKQKYKKDIKNNLKAITYNTERVNNSINLIQLKIYKLIKQNNQEFRKEINRNKIYNTTIFLLGILITIIFTIIISNQITKNLKELEITIRKLTYGELPDYHPEIEENELGYIALNLQKLIEALKETSRFAQELSKGNFDMPFSPLSDKDEFRNLLLDLRDSLKHAKEEEEKRKIEDYQRRRISEGLAKFADILRGHHKDLKKLAEEIIINLVRYLNANQGVFFILNDKDPNNVYLELLAAYAWNRKKYLEKKIALGEGLIGAVAVEKFTIYMTDVPEDYIEIKSGTGEADPRAILIVPLKVQDTVLGVIELATFKEFKQYEIELIEKIGENIASTLQNIRINEKTEELLQRSQKQAEEMRKQEEIMKRTIEELKKAQEENLKKERELQKIIEELDKANQKLKIKDQELEKEINKLREEYNKKLEIIAKLSKAYEQIFEKIKIPIIIFDSQGKIKFANTAVLEILKYDSSKIHEISIDDIFEKTILFENKTPHEFLIENYEKFSTANTTFPIKSSDGEIKKFMIELIKIDADPDNINYALVLISTEEILKKEKDLYKAIEESYAKEIQYLVKIQILEEILRKHNIEPPELDFSDKLIVWSDKFKMGIETIDKQHEKWIYFINELYQALQKNEAYERLNSIFNELMEYTKYHFNFEEKYMKEFDYENYEEHLKEHKYFIDKLYEMFNDFINNKLDTPIKLLTFLKIWVEHHVLHTDRGYSELFKQRGLK